MIKKKESTNKNDSQKHTKSPQKNTKKKKAPRNFHEKKANVDPKQM